MASLFTCVFIALYAGHHLGDQWLQTGWQALTKEHPTRVGRIACLRHVGTLTAGKIVFLWLTCAVLDLRPSVWGCVLGISLDAVSHYWADRRFRLKRLVGVLGKIEYWNRCTVVRAPGKQATDTGPGTGSFHLDQSWHIVWLFLSSLVIAGLS